MQPPSKIRKTENNTLETIWQDGEVFEVDMERLRDECPCVECKGETVIFSSYIPIKTVFKAPGYYEIEKIEPVGNYAVNIAWKDKHSTGLYSWELLKEISKKK